MIKKQNLTEFIQIRVNVEEKAYIRLMAKKHSNKGISGFVLSLLYDELGRLSRLDQELKEAREKLIEV